MQKFSCRALFATWPSLSMEAGQGNNPVLCFWNHDGHTD